MRLISDNGTNFENKIIHDLSHTWGFEFVTSAPKHSRENGKADSAVKIAKRLVRIAEENNEDVWYSLLHLRNTPNNIGSSPNQRFFTRRTRTGVPT